MLLGEPQGRCIFLNVDHITDLTFDSASRQERFPLSTGRDATTAKQVEIINIDEGDELYVLRPLFSIIFLLT